MLSKKTWHCLDILIAMASVPASATVTTQSLAKRLGLSTSYLESLMRLLREADLVRSFRGPGGGYGLARPAQQTSVWDAVSRLENTDAPEEDRQAHDLTRLLEADFRTAFEQYLCSRQLSEFAKPDAELLTRTLPRLSGFRLGPMPPALRPVAPNSVFQLPAFLQGVAA